jgi:hypothetical protein
LVDSKFPINSHENRFKISSERMQQSCRMLDVNVIKNNAIRIQSNINCQKEQLIKIIYHNFQQKKYNFVENIKREVQKMQV